LTENLFGLTYYDLLGVEPNAPDGKIKAFYRLRSLEVHPDRANGNEERQKQLNEAYETLSDPEKRREYNENLGLPIRIRRLKPGQPVYEEIQVDKRDHSRPILFEFSRWEPCSRCWGNGCRHCRDKGKTLEDVRITVNVPNGVSQVVVPGQGARSEPGGSRGDLVLYIVLT
jgi:DnaJ-class molecular chaperone